MWSEIRLIDIKEYVQNFCPVELIYNDKVVWNDDENTIDEYNEFWDKYAYKLVANINITIVHFHHSIVTFRGEE